jgi:purine-binding chemotaxis protein CheW
MSATPDCCRNPITATRRAAMAGAPREYLSFKLGSEEYGIDILRVQEIRGYEPPTRIANTQHFIKGVVNLRGVIVPIVDMRLRFQLADVQYNSFTVVIILNIGNRTVGMVVDSVSDVLELAPGQIKPRPNSTARSTRLHHRPGHDQAWRRGAHADPDGHRADDVGPDMGLMDAEMPIH